MNPIIIFAFNRLDSLISTVESLKANPEASESDLIFYVDGPRQNKHGEDEKVKEVQNYVKTVNGFKSIKYFFSDENKGLAPSIIAGVTETINQYGSVIVIEDDLYVSKSFLRYMNQMLEVFKNDKRIFQISGYSTRMSFNINSDMYLNGRARSWTWATWKDRWDSVDWEVSDYAQLSKDRALQKAFNSHGSDLFNMLKRYKQGKISSWYIRFCYAMHKQGKYCICPSKSLVRNDGFTNEGTHCNNYNRYKIDFEEYHRGEFVVPKNLMPEKKVLKEAIKYWSIKYRIYGKLMTYLYKLKR